MKTAVFSLCHNEELMLPYYFRHYKAFADLIVVADNHSTDNSVEICRKEGVEPYHLKSHNKHREPVMTFAKNNFWKKFRQYDWVFIVDIDELIYHPNIKKFLDESSNYTVLTPTGYQMISEHPPTTSGQIYEEINKGTISDHPACMELFSFVSFHKKCIINPGKILETNYNPGGHEASFIGDVKILTDPNLKLLHFRCLSLDYLIRRNKMRQARLSIETIKKGCSSHYSLSEEKLTTLFNEISLASTSIISSQTI